MAGAEGDSAPLVRAAQILADARIHSRPLPDLPLEARPETLDQAYSVQDELNRLLASSGYGKPTGYKIGCTTGVMQKYLAIPHPCAGRVLGDAVRYSSGKFRREELCRPGVECEIAVRIGRSMIGERPFGAEDCDAYVDAVMASIELVDDRWRDFRSVSTPALISDNFFNAGCVLGAPGKLSGAQLQRLVGKMWVNGVLAGEGTGADILGRPYSALAWLANHQMERGQPLEPGDFVSLGSVVQTRWIEAGDQVEIEFSTLGRCSLEII